MKTNHHTTHLRQHTTIVIKLFGELNENLKKRTHNTLRLLPGIEKPPEHHCTPTDAGKASCLCAGVDCNLSFFSINSSVWQIPTLVNGSANPLLCAFLAPASIHSQVQLVWPLSHCQWCLPSNSQMPSQAALVSVVRPSWDSFTNLENGCLSEVDGLSVPSRPGIHTQ